MKRGEMQVGDIVVADKKVYEVTGIYLGGVATTNLVGLKSVTEHPGYAGNEKVDEMFVPEALVLCAKTYRRVD
jgi:hypothetical protein